MNRVIDGITNLGAAIGIAIAALRWLDAYRLAEDIPLPVPVAWRVLLARYNLLAVSTHIYKAFRALKKPTR